IAIENVRLFNALETRNHDLTDALAQQTATAEILRAISQSQTNLQPVFNAIVQNAVRLCHGNFGVVYRYDGALLHLVAHDNVTGGALEYLSSRFPRPLDGASVALGRAVRQQQVVCVSDFETDPEVAEEQRIGARLRGSRSNVTVPILRDGMCLG